MERRERLDQDIISEKELLGLLGITDPVLERLRQKRNFPYIRIAKGIRVYYEPHIIAWLKKNETSEQTEDKDEQTDAGKDTFGAE